MKKLILSLAIIVLAVGSLFAQPEIKLGHSSGWEQFPVLASDTIKNDGENIEKIFNLNAKSTIQYYKIFVDIDTVLTPAVLTTHNIPVYLQESFNGVDYVTIDTTSFYGTADTTFTIADISTGTIAPYLKVKLDGTDGDSLNVQLMKMVGRFVNK
jgi:hypothetical protein